MLQILICLCKNALAYRTNAIKKKNNSFSHLV